MIPLVEERLADIGRLCREHRVARLELIGSAAAGRYEPGVSDLDFLVTFRPDAPPGGFGGPVTGLSVALSDLLGTRVDLIEEPRIRDPYLLQGIDVSPKASLYLCADAPPPPRAPITHPAPGWTPLQLRTFRYLRAMHDTARGVRDLAEAKPRHVINADLLLRRAVEGSLETIGHAAIRLRRHNPAVAAHISGLDEYAALAAHLLHDYDNVDLNRVWETIERGLPALVRETGELLGVDSQTLFR